MQVNNLSLLSALMAFFMCGPLVANKHVLGGPGDISTNAVYIEADFMYPFNNGAAIIRKSTSTAMIDKNGNVIVPYGKVRFSVINKFIDNGLFAGTRHENSDFVCYLANGKEITEPGAKFTRLTLDGKYACFQKEGQVYVYIDKNGKRLTVKESIEDVSEGIGIVTRRSKLDKYNIANYYRTYMNLNQKVLTTKEYDEITPFSDGMALVGKRDEFGMVKYGFIDSTGKEVVPLKYSNKPSNFKNGLAKVIPANRSDFLYAYINKRGDVVIKHTTQEIKGMSAFSEFRGNGYAFSNNWVMDTTGRIIPNKEIFSKFGFKTDKQIFNHYFNIDSKGIYVDGLFRVYTQDYNATLKDRRNCGGFYNIKTGKMAQAVFNVRNEDGYDLVFSPSTKLAYAQLFLGKDAAGNEMFRRGYINEDGVFEILQKSADKW